MCIYIQLLLIWQYVVFKCREDQPVVMQWSNISEPDLKTGPEEAPSDYELPMTQCAAYDQGFNPGDRIEDAVYEKVDV